MAENFSVTMRNLAEDNHFNKTALRLMLKYEIQSLMERLSELGDDCLLLMVNVQEGSSNQIGAPSALSFLNVCQQNYNLNLRETYLKFCSTFTGPVSSGLHQVGTVNKQMDGRWQESNMVNIGNQNQPAMNRSTQAIPSLTAMIGKPQINTNRFAPYVQRKGMQAGNQVQNFSQLQAASNLLSQLTQRVAKPLMSLEVDRKKKSACRHYLKGNCWQGGKCSFVHTRDPQVLKSLGHNSNPPTSQPSQTVSPSSDSQHTKSETSDAAEGGQVTDNNEGRQSDVSGEVTPSSNGQEEDVKSESMENKGNEMVNG